MYYLVYGIFYLLSLLPWRVIYLISDGIFGLLYYVIGYRKKVVHYNLKITFPEKSDHERKKIAKQFYKNFTDNFIEVIKILFISEKELDKRFICNYDVVNDLYASGKNVQLLLGHFFNWEYCNLAFAKNFSYPFICVYMPVSNKIFNRLFYRLRSRFGAQMVDATQYGRQFIKYARGRYVNGLGADQSPGGPDNVYWAPFFGRMTPFVKGPEKGSLKENIAVVIGAFIKVRRGYYKCELKLLTTDPLALPAGEITKQMVKFLEEEICRQPSNYLWSHRRWKWEFDEEKYGKLVI